MSIRLMTAVWEQADVAGGELLVLLALADAANDKGLCWPSVHTLARKSRLSERHVVRILRSLENSGLLEVQRGCAGFGTNLYRVGGDILSGGDAHVTPGVTPMSP